MKSEKRIVKNIAKSYNFDPDELLIMLWYFSEEKDTFGYIKSPDTVVRNRHLKLVRDIIRTKKKDQDFSRTDRIHRSSIRPIFKNFEFSSIGKGLDPISYITKDEILIIHKELTDDFQNLEDPILPSGLKDETLLESALFHPQTSFSGKVKYSTAETSGAALMYALSHNHAFHNGNKRTAVVATLVFLDRHNICLTCNEDELFKVSLDLADHKLVKEEYRYPDAEIFELARWIHGCGKVMKRGERPMTLRKFKQILTNFDCLILDNGKVSRSVKSSGVFKFSSTLLSKRSIGDTVSDGTELAPRLIKSIREDLKLDATHGIDSDTFYAGGKFSSSEFIIKYKNLLRRLSKF